MTRAMSNFYMWSAIIIVEVGRMGKNGEIIENTIDYKEIYI